MKVSPRVTPNNYYIYSTVWCMYTTTIRNSRASYSQVFNRLDSVSLNWIIELVVTNANINTVILLSMLKQCALEICTCTCNMRNYHFALQSLCSPKDRKTKRSINQMFIFRSFSFSIIWFFDLLVFRSFGFSILFFRSYGFRSYGFRSFDVFPIDVYKKL